MGTENYKDSDFDHLSDDMTFDKYPINLKINKTRSYTCKIKNRVMKTQNNDAKVEYILNRWRINHEGCMLKIQQSNNFKLSGCLKKTHPNEMRLHMSDGGNYIYVQQ